MGREEGRGEKHKNPEKMVSYYIVSVKQEMNVNCIGGVLGEESPETCCPQIFLSSRPVKGTHSSDFKPQLTASPGLIRVIRELPYFSKRYLNVKPTPQARQS